MVRAGCSLLCFAIVAVATPAAAATAPETGITAGPIGRTADSSPNFAFESSDPAATFECSLDGAAFTPCASPKSYAGVTESPHTFAVRAVDSAGNVDPTPAQRSFTADASVEATASAARSQRETGAIRVAVRVDAAEPLTIVATGAIDLANASFGLMRERQRVLRPGRAVLRLTPVSSDDAATIARALNRKGTTARAKVGVRLTDVLGNETRVPLSVRLKGERMGRP